MCGWHCTECKCAIIKKRRVDWAKLTKQQVKERKMLLQAIPEEDHRLALTIGICKSASHIINHVFENASLRAMHLPTEILYRMALIHNVLLGIFGEGIEKDGSFVFECKKVLKERDVNERFGIVIKELYEEAIRRGIVKP
jgi:hypothetical protein